MTSKNSELPKRKSPRLSGWNYAETAWYFITICTLQHRYYFGNVKDVEVTLTPLGQIAQACWLQIPEHFDVELDEFVIMPNHIHGIIALEKPSKPLGTIINGYKGAVTRGARANGFADFAWQPRYYDHIIRNDRALCGIREYISNNPPKWELEKGHTENISLEGIY